MREARHDSTPHLAVCRAEKLKVDMARLISLKKRGDDEPITYGPTRTNALREADRLAKSRTCAVGVFWLLAGGPTRV